MYIETVRRYRNPKGNRLPSNAYWYSSTVYTEAEAKEAGLDYVHWKQWEGNKYILSDDGMVLEVLNVKTMTSKNGSSTVISVPKDRFIKSHSSKAFIYNRDKKAEDIEKELRSSRAKLAVTVYSRFFLKRKAINWEILGNILRPTITNPKMFAQIFFRKKEVKAMVRKEVADAMLGEGFTPQGIAAEYRGLIDMCKDKKDRENYRLTLERLSDMLDMMPERRQFNTNMNVNMNSELPAGTNAMLDEAEEQMRLAMEVKTGKIEVIQP